MKSTIVIGADSFIGSAIFRFCQSKGTTVYGTTKNPGEVKSGKLFLDFASSEFNMNRLPEAEIAYICAGINGFNACASNPTLAARVNIESTIAVATRLMEQGSHVIFLSSTAVFGTTGAESCFERANPHPTTLYGAYKAATEFGLAAAASLVAGKCTVVRLTKVVNRKMSLINHWETSYREGGTINAHIDQHLSPISLGYVVSGLIKIGQSITKIPVAHLAGERPITYYDFAKMLAINGLWPESKIDIVAQSEFQPIYKLEQSYQLTMHETREIFGIEPQSYNAVINDLNI